MEILLVIFLFAGSFSVPLDKLEVFYPEDILPAWKSLSSTSNWHCGSVKAEITMITARILTLVTCEEFREKLDYACEKHDVCYAEQRGQGPCDYIFCEDLDIIRVEGGCSVVTHSFCTAVKAAGHKFYNDTKTMEKLGRRLRQQGIPVDLPSSI